MDGHAVIVGGSMGGLRAAEQLRACGWTGPVTVVGAERHAPYNRPPLSTSLLERPAEGATPTASANRWLAAVALRPRATADAIAWRLGRRAVAASLAERTVALDDGAELRWDALVVATGLRPRRLPLPGGAADRHVLRTLDDAARLRPRLAPGARVVIVGGGFVGCELAATARMLGCDVTVVEPASAPMAHALGADLGTAVARHHAARGVRFRLGRAVRAFVPPPGRADRIARVELDDGSALAADVVVEAVGSLPNVEWLDGNGLDLRDGVLCDDALRVEGRPDVVAVGDVARFPNPRVDAVPRRVEHWSMAAETARCAARTLVAGADGPARRPFAPLPTFWSDQFDLRIQGFGAFALGERRAVLAGALDDVASGVAVGSYIGGRLVGVVTVGLPAARALHYRTLITEPTVEVAA